LLTQRSIAVQTNTALGLQTEDSDLCQKKQPSIHNKAAEHYTHAAHHHGEAAKHHEGGRHEKAGHHAHTARATRFTLEITPKKLPKPTWRNTARNGC
jgi:hypothetical protein